MFLTEEQNKQFVGYCESSEPLKIIGFNDLGQRFETVGRVTRTDNGKPAVFSNEIFFDFGAKREGKNYSEFLAPFKVDFFPDVFEGTQLIVEKICLASGEVIFENPDAKEYFATAQEIGKKKEEEHKAEGRDLGELDPITAKLDEVIGKPILINGEKAGVLASYSGFNNAGKTMIQVRDATLCGGLSIPMFGTLDTVDLEGKIIPVEANGKTLEEEAAIKRVMKARQEKVNGLGWGPGSV